MSVRRDQARRRLVGCHVSAIEVFADVRCPFTHVGLRRLVAHRDAVGADLVLRIRAWPLELVNGTSLDPRLIADEVSALRKQVAPDLFAGFNTVDFPESSLPALGLAATAYQHDLSTGERVSLLLRDALFEGNRDISRPDVLAEIAAAAGLTDPSVDDRAVLGDWHEGQERGVVGSPHFFVGDDGFFCPSLAIEHTEAGLQISFDRVGFDAFLARCVAG